MSTHIRWWGTPMTQGLLGEAIVYLASLIKSAGRWVKLQMASSPNMLDDFSIAKASFCSWLSSLYVLCHLLSPHDHTQLTQNFIDLKGKSCLL